MKNYWTRMRCKHASILSLSDSCTERGFIRKKLAYFSVAVSHCQYVKTFAQFHHTLQCAVKAVSQCPDDRTKQG